MKFGEYRREFIGWNTKVFIQRTEGKKLIKEEYVGADFDEDETYSIDDLEVKEIERTHGIDKAILRLF